MIVGPGMRSLPSMVAKGRSPLRLCLKYLQEGHDPMAAIEFVAEWGEAGIKSQFQNYVKLLKQGRSIEAVLDDIAAAYPSPETELLVAAMEARIQSGHFSELVADAVQQSETAESRVRGDMEVLLGPGRRWTLGLVWTGILGGAMLLIALPQYSALLQSALGRVVLGAAIGLEITGLLWAGVLLGMQRRIESELSQK